MWKWKGDGSQYVPGVPMQDLSDKAMEEHVRAGRITPKEPAAALWEHVEDKPAEPVRKEKPNADGRN